MMIQVYTASSAEDCCVLQTLQLLAVAVMLASVGGALKPATLPMSITIIYSALAPLTVLLAGQQTRFILVVARARGFDPSVGEDRLGNNMKTF